MKQNAVVSKERQEEAAREVTRRAMPSRMPGGNERLSGGRNNEGRGPTQEGNQMRRGGTGGEGSVRNTRGRIKRAFPREPSVPGARPIRPEIPSGCPVSGQPRQGKLTSRRAIPSLTRPWIVKRAGTEGQHCAEPGTWHFQQRQTQNTRWMGAIDRLLPIRCRRV